ncbi:hypothetical protein HK104_002920, partial [Borealophlyctis nickersoniae]
MLDAEGDTSFKPGDKVWAKLKGFPWWPGRIEDESNLAEDIIKQRPSSSKNLTVYYHGSRDYGFFAPEELKPFDKHYNEYATKSKAAGFKQALAEALDPSIVERELEEAKAAESETRKSSTSSKKGTRSASGSTANNGNPRTKPSESGEEASRSKTKKRLRCRPRGITDLPLELLEQIVSHVPIPDIFRLPDVSNKFEKATRRFLSLTSPKMVSHFRERFHLHISVQTDIDEDYEFQALRAHVFPKLRAKCKVSAEEMRLFKLDNLLEQYGSLEEVMEYMGFDDEEELNEYLDSLDQDDEKLMEEGIREPINYYMDWMVINGYGDNWGWMRDFVWTLGTTRKEGDWVPQRRGMYGSFPGIYRFGGAIQEKPSKFTIMKSVQLSVDTADYDENEADENASDDSGRPDVAVSTIDDENYSITYRIEDEVCDGVSEISFPSVKIPVSLVQESALAHWKSVFNEWKAARERRIAKERRDKLWNEVAAPFVDPYNRVFDDSQNKHLQFKCATEGHHKRKQWREILHHLKENHLNKRTQPSEYEKLLPEIITVVDPLIGEFPMPVPEDLSTFIATLRQKRREEETRRETERKLKEEERERQRKLKQEQRERQRKEDEARRKTEREERERLWNQVAMPFIRPYGVVFKGQYNLKFTCIKKKGVGCEHMATGVNWDKLLANLKACHLDECTKATEGNENPMPSIFCFIDREGKQITLPAPASLPSWLVGHRIALEPPPLHPQKREKLWNKVAMPFIRPYDAVFNERNDLKFTCLKKDVKNCKHMKAGVNWEKLLKNLKTYHLVECTKVTQGNENPMPSIFSIIDKKGKQ